MNQFNIIFAAFSMTVMICNTSAQQANLSDSSRFILVKSYVLTDGPVKFIEDNQGHMIIVNIGKNGSIGIIKDAGINPIVKGYIADAVLGVDGNIWYIGESKISSVTFSGKNTNQNHISLFFKNNIPEKFNYSDYPLFYRDRFGSVWLAKAPFRAGAGGKSLPNPESGKISEKFPLPLATDPFSSMWGLITLNDKGIKKVGVLSPLTSKQWTVFDNKNGLPDGDWNSLTSDIEGITWVSGSLGLYYFDPFKAELGWLPYMITDQYPGGAVSQMTLSSTGHVLLALKNSELFEVNVDTKNIPLTKHISKTGLPKSAINTLYTDRAGRIWLVSQNKLYRQDKQQLRWQPLTSMPYGNHDLFVVEHNGKIFTPGGGAYHDFPPASTNFDCMLIYDIKNDRWEISPKMSINRRYCSVGILDGKIWVIGGFHKTSNNEKDMWNDSPVNTVEIYDPVNMTWSAGPALDVPRAETVTCTMAGRLYVFGSTGKETFKTLSIAPGEKEWRTEPTAPYPVFQTTGCVLNNQAYIMTGSNGLIMYDPATQTWQKNFPPIPGAKAPFSSIVVTYKKEIWVISGRGNDDGTKTWIYLPQGKQWREGPSIQYPTMWANGIEVNGDLYVFGGATTSKIRGKYVYWDAIRVLR